MRFGARNIFVTGTFDNQSFRFGIVYQYPNIDLYLILDDRLNLTTEIVTILYPMNFFQHLQFFYI